MAISISFLRPMTCNNCGQEFDLTIWAVVDAEERPDLFDRMLDGSFTHHFCPECSEPILATLPAVLFQRTAPPHLILCTSDEGEPDPDQLETMTGLIAHLRQRLGKEWDDDWVSSGVPHATYDQLPLVLSDIRTSAGRDPLEQLLHQFVIAPSWSENRRLLEEHPELLDPRVEELIARLGFDRLERVSDELHLLRRCREEGLESVFDSLFGSGLPAQLQHAETLLAQGDYQQAYRVCQETLEVCDRLEEPLHWAWLNFSMAACLSRRAANELEHRAETIAHLSAALEVYSREETPEQWATCHATLSSLYAGSRSSYHLALQSLSNAQEVFSKDTHPIQWAQLQSQFANACLNDPLRGRAEAVEEAIPRLELAMEAYSPQEMPDKWVGLCATLCGLYRERVGVDRSDYVERAIELGTRALTVLSMRHADQLEAMTHSNLGSAYSERLKGVRSENLELAVDHQRKALELVNRETAPRSFATVQHNLARALLLRGQEGGDPGDLDEAVEQYSAALEACPRSLDGRDHAHTTKDLGVAYLERGQRGSPEDVDAGIRMLERAAAVYRDIGDTEEWAQVQVVLGSARGKRGTEEDIRQARAELESALRAQQLPDRRVATLRARALFEYEQREWEAAHDFASQALDLSQDQLRGAYTEAGRMLLDGEVSELATIDAHALLRMHEPLQSLERLEEGKVRRLTEALFLEDELSVLPQGLRCKLTELRDQVRELEQIDRIPAETPGRRSNEDLGRDLARARAEFDATMKQARSAHPERLPSQSGLDDLLNVAPPGGALAIWMVAPGGTAVFVLPDGSAELGEGNVVLLDDFTASDLSDVLHGNETQAGWFTGYSKRAEDPGPWEQVIVDTGALLWDRLVGPVAERLERLGVPKEAEVTLVPFGRMSVLPLHLAWRTEAGEPRYLIDDYCTSYAPSAVALQRVRSRLAERSGGAASLLAVIDPTGDLPYAHAEGRFVAAMFDENAREVLVGSDARPRSVVAQCAGKSHLHFACHGQYAWHNPLRSGLTLADNVALALSEILSSVDLESARLVTLSACESGLSGMDRSPHELLGLPAGFLHAGAPAVISSLWEVDDVSTMCLMKRMYELHLQGGLAPARALRGAQGWLRSISPSELDRELSAAEREGKRTEATAARGRGSHRRSTAPLAHPYHWGGFAVTGI